MNIRKKLAAVLLSLCMLTAAAMPGFATEPTGSPAPSTTPTAVPTASPSVSEEGSVYVSSYDVEVNEDKDYTLEYTDGNKSKSAQAKKVTLHVVDTRVKTPGVINDNEYNSQINVQINGRNFSVSKENISVSKDSGSAAALLYKIELSNLSYNGSGDGISDDNTLRLDVNYCGEDLSTLPLATIEQKLSRFGTQTVTTPESTPEPTATPTPEPTPTPDPTYRTPSLIIRSTSIGGATVDAGDDFTLSLEVYATSSGTEPLCDVLVAISPADGVTLASGSTTRYIGDMDAGTSQTVTYKMHAQNSFTGGTSSVSVSLSANGKTTGAGAQATGTTVTVPVIQPERFEISNLEIPESITVGEENYASVTFVNKGKNELSNMTVTTTGSNLQEAEQNTFVGNVTAGSEQSVDINLCALEAGEVEGTISFVYEDSSGQEVTVTRNFSCTAEDAAMWDSDYIDSDYSDMNQETDTGSTGLPVWAWLLIAAVIAALCVAGVRVAKKHRSAGNLEEDNADF